MTQAQALQKEQLKIEGEPECLAYLSAATLHLGHLNEALSFSDLAVNVLRSRQFSEEDVQLTYYYRYLILEALQLQADAIEALRVAYQNVIEQAESLKDEEGRQGFIENFPLRKNICEAWKRIGLGGLTR